MMNTCIDDGPTPQYVQPQPLKSLASSLQPLHTFSSLIKTIHPLHLGTLLKTICTLNTQSFYHTNGTPTPKQYHPQHFNFEIDKQYSVERTTIPILAINSNCLTLLQYSICFDLGAQKATQLALPYLIAYCLHLLVKLSALYHLVFFSLLTVLP